MFQNKKILVLGAARSGTACCFKLIKLNKLQELKLGSLNYKKQMIGELTVGLVNEARNQLMSISAANQSIKMDTEDYEEETKKVIRDGWFYTGDLGYMDKDGYIFLTGRQKDMIVLKNGKKVFPEEVEAILEKSNYISEVCVLGTSLLCCLSINQYTNSHSSCSRMVFLFFPSGHF